LTEDKNEGFCFYTSEVPEAKPQAALNTLTEHDFQDAYKNCRTTGTGEYAWKGTTSRVIVANRPKVIF
jgi:hypothetical protein